MECVLKQCAFLAHAYCTNVHTHCTHSTLHKHVRAHTLYASQEFNLPNKRGTVTMARWEDPNSGEGEFFINLGDSPHLDKSGNSGWALGFTVFGQHTHAHTNTERMQERHRPIDTLILTRAIGRCREPQNPPHTAKHAHTHAHVHFALLQAHAHTTIFALLCCTRTYHSRWVYFQLMRNGNTYSIDVRVGEVADEQGLQVAERMAGDVFLSVRMCMCGRACVAVCKQKHMCQTCIATWCPKLMLLFCLLLRRSHHNSARRIEDVD